MERYTDKLENELQTALKKTVSDIEPQKNLLAAILERLPSEVTTQEDLRYINQDRGKGRISRQLNSIKEFMTQKTKLISALAVVLVLVGIGLFSYTNQGGAPTPQEQAAATGNPDDIYNALVSDSMEEEAIIHDYNWELEEFSSNDQSINELDTIYDESQF